MKSILSTNPTFTTGASNVGTLNFSAINGFQLNGLLAVLNQTRGVLLYATGKQPTGYFSWNSGTKVMTLKVDTSAHSSGDQLQCIYDGPGSNEAALTSVISGAVTDSVITASPAILLGFSAGGVTDLTYDFLYKFTIKNGNTILFENIGNSPYPASGINQLPNGIDCPNGIKVTTAKRFSADAPTYIDNARLTINYILK